MSAVTFTESAVFAERRTNSIDRAERTAILVIIVGFMGSNPKQMRRYEDIYLSLPLPVSTLLVIPPVQFVMTAGIVANGDLETGYEAVARDIALFMEDYSSSAKVVLHNLSQNASFLYMAMVREEKFNMDRVSAIIFDSAPVAMTSKAVWNASKAVMGARFAKQAIAFMKHMIEGDYEEHLAKRTDSVLDAFERHGPRSNALFLYSSSDEITDASFVRKIVNICGGESNHVEAFDFGASSHVSHILYDFKTYTETVTAFIKKSLSSGPERSKL